MGRPAAGVGPAGAVLALALLVEGIGRPGPAYVSVLLLALCAATAVATHRLLRHPGHGTPVPLALLGAAPVVGVLLAAVAGVPGVGSGSGDTAVHAVEALLVALPGACTAALALAGRVGGSTGVAAGHGREGALCSGGWPPVCCSSRTTT